MTIWAVDARGVARLICTAIRCFQWDWRGDELEASLGKLVKFDLQHKAVRSGAIEKPGNAQILMFTGVRYERGTSQKPTTWLDPTRPKHKRG